MSEDRKIHQKFVDSLGDGGLLPYYDETKNNIYEKGWTACYKHHQEQIEQIYVYKDTPIDILIRQAYYDKYPPLLDTENSFSYFKDGYIEGFNYMKNKYNLFHIKFTKDWKEAFKQTFPNISVFDELSIRAYENAFMEGFKFSSVKQFTIEDITKAMIFASSMHGKVSDIQEKQIPDYIQKLLNTQSC